MIGFRLDHIHLESRDPQATAAYYRELFDGVVHEWTQLDGRRRFDVHIGDLKLYIKERAADGNDAGDGRTSAIHHFALRVDDLARASEQLKRRGARFVEEPRVSRLRPGLRVAFVEAPEGVLIELLSSDPPVPDRV